MSDFDELQRLRRLRELEEKAGGGGSAPTSNPAVEFAKGLKGGFDRAAYGVAGLMPDLPIPEGTRNAWNKNMLVRALGITAPSANERQQAIDQSRQVADGSMAGAAGDFIGNALPAVGVGVATGGLGVAPAAALQATTAYATTPGDMADRATSAAFAAGGEGVGRALPFAVSRLAQPIRPTEAAERLIAKGVYPTPGGAAGGGFKKFEDALTSAPGVGAAVQRGQRDAMEQGAQLAMSQGGVNVPAGRKGYQALSQYFDDAFSNATKPLAFDLNDPAFDAGVQKIMQARGLDKAGVDDVNRFFSNYRTNTNMPAPNPGTGVAVPGTTAPRQLVGGEDFHSMLQQLRQEGAAFRKAQDPFQKRLGEAYRDIYNLADNTLATQGIVKPDDVAAFREIRRQYANVAPALKAGELNTVNRNQGVFTPEQYQNSMVNNAKQMGNKAQVRMGTLPQQQLADDMVEVLGGRYPDSGTAYRLALSGGIPLGAALVDPVTGVGTAAGIAAGYGIGRGIYSEPGRKFMVGGYNGQRAIADALRNFSPYAGTVGAATAPQLDW